MRKNKENKCVACGEKFVPKLKGRQRIYCSQKCSNKIHNNKRRLQTMEAGGKIKCHYCGKEFERDNESKRAYCTNKCAAKVSRSEEVKELRELAEAEKNSGSSESFKDFVLSLYHRGYGRTAMTEAFGIKLSTLKCWIDRTTNPNAPYLLRQKAKKKQHKAIRDYTYEHAQNAEEWVSELRKQIRCNMSNFAGAENNATVYLISGKVHSNKSAENLYDIAMLKTEFLSQDENVFVFCGNKRTNIRYIYNDGKGLRMVSCRKNSGTYPWPSPKLGGAIRITAQDFELLLSETEGGHYGQYRITWNNINLTN